MRAKPTLSMIATTLTLALLLTSAALASAQESAEAATQSAAAEVQGVGTLFLLIGLGAIGLVSLIWIARERAAAKNTTDVP